MDTNLRERLQELAGEMPADPRMPVSVKRRIRFRRGTNAIFAVMMIAALVVGGAVGIPAAIRGAGRTQGTLPGANNGEWRGIWPQATREEAERAQACADAGDDSCAWQLDPQETILRWLHAQGGSAKANFSVPAGIAQSDSPGPYNIEIREAYQPGFVFQVTIERLVRSDHTGIWSVTNPTFAEASPISPGVTQAVFAVSMFMQDRQSGDPKAETYLSAAAKGAYDRHEGGLWLFSPLQDQHYYGFDIANIADGTDPGDFRIQVVIQEASPSSFTETLVVGPGTTFDGHDLPFVILSAARFNGLPAGFTFSPIPSP